MDLVPIVNGAGANASDLMSTLAANWQQWSSTIILIGILAVLAGFVARIWKRASVSIETILFSNWRLALLGATGLVLSLASGWTTWDGMRNFTNEPLLSGMITFGIQGVMLIVAWLIGESFATGMNQRHNGSGGWDVTAAGLIALLTMISFGIWFGGSSTGTSAEAGLQPVTNWFDSPEAHTIQRFAAYAAITAVLAAVVITLHQSDFGANYVQSARIMVKNGVLWVMFLACMATSVFFSFDSLFSTIFPAEERQRAAELRAQNQVAGLVADIGATITTQRAEEQQALFTTKAWLEYEAQLDKLASQAQGAKDEIEKFFVKKMEERRQMVSEQQERMASAQSGQAGLQARKIQMTEELSRLAGDRPQLAVAVQQQQQVVLEIERSLDEKRALTLAEEKGVEGSGKVGRGQFWRAAKAEEAKVRAQLQVAKERLASPQKRLANLDKRSATIKAELAQIDGEIAKLEGEALTAEQRIQAFQQPGAEEKGPAIDPSRVLPIFERAKAEFRQQPTVQRLAKLQQQCGQLVAAMASTPATKDKVRGIDCDPKYASEAATTVFALNRGAETFAATCEGGDRIAQQRSTDALFAFARKCLSDSGLPSANTDRLRTTINISELNRDDKAHRFVVTWNAFQDGNRLAYLALAIAIAIDALVFMSGLFGANAVRSPLQDVPSRKAYSAKQLEAMIENALLPDVFENAHGVLSVMQPTDRPIDGFTQEIVIPYHAADGYASVFKVLNAASAIGAAHRDEHRPERYFVRAELVQFLNLVVKRALEENKDLVRLVNLRQDIAHALQPDPGGNAEVVLRNLTPITRRTGDFSSLVVMRDVPAEDERVVRNLLNAGTTMDVVMQSRDKGEEDYYLVHRQLYRTLARIAATTPKLPDPRGRRLLDGPRHGGALNEAERGISERPSRTLLNAPDRAEGADNAYASGKAEFNIEALSGHYRTEILVSLGFADDSVDQIISNDDIIDAASDAWTALAAEGKNNHLLRGKLHSFERQFEKLFAQSVEGLVHPQDRGTQREEVAEDIALEVEQAKHMLLLHPDAGLIEDLIEGLEQAAASDGGLRQAEDSLLFRLRNVREHLRNSDLSLVKPWRDIEGILLSHPDEDLPKVIRPQFNRNDNNS